MATDNAQNFVELPITVDPGALVDVGIDYLRSQWDGWEPSEGDPEVVALEAHGPLVAAAAQIAAEMSKAALIAYATQVMSMVPKAGTYARAEITIEVTDNVGYLVPIGVQFDIDGFAFALTDNAVVPAGSTSVAGVEAACAVVGSDANGLTGDTAEPLTMPSFVTAITLDAPTHDGADDESPDEFLARIVSDQRLRGKTLVTADNFRAAALDQPNIGRAYAVGNTANEMTVWVADLAGEPVAPADKTALANYYQTFRMANVTWNIQDPTYTTVNIAWTAVASPTADKVALRTAINDMLAGLLDPLGWGTGDGPGQGPTVWTGEGVVRRNVLIGKIEQIPSVRYVDTITITSTTAGAVEEANGDLTMATPAPLPRAGAIGGVVS